MQPSGWPGGRLPSSGSSWTGWRCCSNSACFLRRGKRHHKPSQTHPATPLDISLLWPVRAGCSRRPRRPAARTRTTARISVHRTCSAASSSTMTATAPPASGAVPTWPTTRPTPSNPWPNPTTPQPRTVGVAVVPLVGVEASGSSALPPRRRAHRWNVVHHGRQHGHVSDVGGGDHRGQWQPTAVADQVELAPRLATIHGICAHLVPHALRARSWCPRWPATSPAGPAHPADPDLEVGLVEHADVGPLGRAAPAGRR
jgi:hypothetical protein